MAAATHRDRGLGKTPMFIPFGNLQGLDMIGCGGFGRVFKARYVRISKCVAYKEFGHFYNQLDQGQKRFAVIILRFTVMTIV